MPLRLLAALGCGVLLSLAFEPVTLPVVVPFAVAGFVLSVRGLRARSAWLPGLAFGIGFQFVLIYWMRAVGTDAWIALATAEAAFLALLGSLTAVLCRHRWWPLWTAAAWVAVEVWRSGWPFSGMPWGRLAFATVDTPVSDALPYVSAVGVSFLMALSGTLLAWVVVARGRERRTAAIVLVALVALSLLPSLVPWQPSAEDEEGAIRVVAVQGDVPGNGDDILYDYRQVTQNQVDVTQDLAADVAAGDQPEPDFVVWPENSTAVDPFRDQQTNSAIWTASHAIGVPILVGAIVDAGPDHVLNQGIVWDPVTGAGDRYTKRHPVPYGEYIPGRKFFSRQFGRLADIPRDMLSGTRSEPLRIAGVPVADAICFDVAYDDGIFAQVDRGAELLTVQTSNATFIHTDQVEQQFAITRLRAQEAGRWLVVASTNGITGIVAPDGHVEAEAGQRTKTYVAGDVQLISATTPAVWMGPWPGRVLLGLTLLGLVLALVPYRRREHQTRRPDESTNDPHRDRESALETGGQPA
ncbi:apolipoprotein N-acyltransferase [Nocardioides mangrovi]|uniref:Apolipoprotein N-acyltransferase n=1 Tax=Nocardioides mangrovi TaxID=2874580 RepID=A0ABS7UG43_9ACTN|nr:apolipoprotein N-acyltransferase [Nocardioides mangrovi]MBZ5739852.1 apolipoprotein N-acyltransferase [Nocardioides mangrovi]